MSVTQVQTSGITDDAVTNAKIADSAVGTAQIANDAVTADKLNNTIQSGSAPVFGVRAWGFLNSGGSIIRGSGNFSASRQSDGRYRVDIDPGQDVPSGGDGLITATIVVTALDNDEEDHYAHVKRVGARSFEIHTRDPEDNNDMQDTNTSFMVIW